MKRHIHSQLVEWKNSKNRKPLILEGARQVGKTWVLQDFGKTEYENFVYINCDNNPEISSLFFDYDTNRLIRNFSALTNQTINPQNTLIILDEIQECPKALTSLKYFCEDSPEYHIAVAGSLLGLVDHAGTGFPVGKVDTLNLYPLSFMEFLDAMGKTLLAEEIKRHNWAELNVFLPQLTELLHQYYFTGGMPEVVLTYINTQNLKQVRQLQKSILKDYEKDFSKHLPKSDISKISLVWNSIPAQLAKENKKFIYGAIKSGGRAKDFENAIQWLINAGLVHKVNRVKSFKMPLKFYEDFSCFKLFVNDVGLLGAMVDVPASEILIGNKAFSHYKGSFTEQFVVQEFFSVKSQDLYYYTNENSTLEIDFVVQTEKVFPIEVKAQENLKAKSLSSVLNNNSELSAIEFSMTPYKEKNRVTHVPLPLVGEYLREL